MLIHEDVGVNLVLASLVPYVRMQAVVDGNIVPGMASEALTQFESTREHKVVVNIVVTRSVIQVNIPSMVTAPAAVPDYGGFHGIEEGQVWFLVYSGLGKISTLTPVPITSP